MKLRPLCDSRSYTTLNSHSSSEDVITQQKQNVILTLLNHIPAITFNIMGSHQEARYLSLSNILLADQMD